MCKHRLAPTRISHGRSYFANVYEKCDGRDSASFILNLTLIPVFGDCFDEDVHVSFALIGTLKICVRVKM